MITREILEKVIDDQQHAVEYPPVIPRTLVLPDSSKQVIIITGIRRCGKSTYLRKTIGVKPESISISFEDPRLEGFDLKDFSKIENLGKQSKKTKFIFDEIQNINDWEKYVRSANERGIQVFITGSNASLLSRELGTRLTGRFSQFELFPFNYQEYLNYTRNSPGSKSLHKFLKSGGFPEYLRDKDDSYLRQLLKDIIIRDIAVRRNIRNEHTVTRLAVHLLSNIGKEFSYNNITRLLEIKSIRSTIDYCDYLAESYIVELIPMYATSIKKQIANPKKAYSLDNGLARTNSLSFSEDRGRMLENAVFQHIRRAYHDIMYHKTPRSECDFLIREQERILMAIQACWHVNEDNIQREINGIKNAMKETQARNGIVVTFDQEDQLDGIKLIPAWKWLQSDSFG
jgi:predicted AAA+ superfamily ATPase